MFTYCCYLRSDDLRLDKSFVESTKHSVSVTTSTAGAYIFENYIHDESVLAHDVDCTGLDPILEICITDGDVIEEEAKPWDLVTANRPRLPSPDREFMDQLIKQSNGGTGTCT